MRKRYNITHLKDFAETKGGLCLTAQYVNPHFKYEWQCSAGHIWKAAWNDIQKGHWCKICAYVGIAKKNQKYDEVSIKALTDKHGIVCLDTKIKRTTARHNWRCRNNHEWKASLACIEMDKGCPVCNKRKILKQAEELSKLKCLETDFTGFKKKYHWQCEKGHVEKRTTFSVKVTPYCTICKKEENQQQKLLILKQEAQKRGGVCVSDEYKQNYEKLEFTCEKGHAWQARSKDIKDGTWCPKCRQYKTEKEILNFIQQFVVAEKTKLSCLGINSKKEIDIYIPSLRLGIEYCGIYWHSSKYKNKNYHYDKYALCKNNNIRLITIFEDEWVNRKAQVKSFLQSAIKANTAKLAARTCAIKEISKEEAINFNNMWHIQPIKKVKIAFGLYFEQDLVGIIIGNMHHRQKYENSLVLSRLVFKGATSIRGGSSKLLKALKNYAKENNYNKIITWADHRYTQGNVYFKLDFTAEEVLSPDYSYITPNKVIRKSKQSCKKANLVTKGATGTTELEMANSLGLYRIYDCGKTRFELVIT